MKSATLAVRTAFIQRLQDNVIYAGVTLPVREELLDSKTPVTVTYGAAKPQAYILVHNQTANDISAKCMRSDECSIQVQINTLFPKGHGGSKLAEQISELVFDQLFPVNDLDAGLVSVDGTHIYKSTLESNRNISYDTDTHTVWIVNLVFSCWISQS